MKVLCLKHIALQRIVSLNSCTIKMKYLYLLFHFLSPNLFLSSVNSHGVCHMPHDITLVFMTPLINHLYGSDSRRFHLSY